MFKVEEVLSKDSAQVLEDGDNPGPLEEIKFWESKKVNLESLFEQMNYRHQWEYSSYGTTLTACWYLACFMVPAPV